MFIMLTNKQLSYIRVLEQKSKLKFNGTTTQEMSKFVDIAKQTIKENNSISRKVEREHEKFPFPDLKDNLPTQKQWEYIESLEEKTMIKFNGVTKKDAIEYIDMVVKIIKGG